MIRAELLSIGDEILIGQIVNTNASFISQQLNAIGIDVHRITTVGDNEKDILEAIKRAWKESDVVIATGGLGPTHDDISKNLVAKFFGKPLRLDKKTLAHVKARFKRLGYKKMPEVNIGQAMVPKDFIALRNDHGTAPGLWYTDKGKTFVILAGVPHEMKFLMAKWVIPSLRKTYKGKFGQAIIHKTLLATGIGESALAEKVGDMKDILEKGATLAFLPKTSGIRLRISARAENQKKALSLVSRVESRILLRAGAYVFGADDDRLEEVVIKLLKEHKKTISTAESCTGGLLSEKLTNISGASEVFPGGIVSYSYEAKTKELRVPSELLRKHGAVSEECAKAMAEGALKKFGTDYALAITGVAGPDGGTKEKPVGMVWIALAEKGKETATKLLQTAGSRSIVRERSTDAALDKLRRRLAEDFAVY
jgi:nicotinamide-nucleotide amidase